jgi:signal transduction histidine kinase/CheY-like chemotaxis protein
MVSNRRAQILDNVPTDLRQRLIKAAAADQAQRMVHSFWVYPLLLILVASSTKLFQERPVLAWSVTGLLLAFIGLRAVLLLGFERVYRGGEKIWIFWSSVASIGTSFTVGTLYASVLALYGPGHWYFASLTLWVSGLAAGSAIIFVPSAHLAVIQFAGLLFPALCASLWLGGQEANVTAGVLLTFVVFLTTQHRRLYLSYWQEAVIRALEVSRTRELEDAKRQAETANQSKSQFLASISHELRTPLHGILGTAQLMDGTDLNAEQREYLGSLAQSAQGLLTILNDVLDLSKIEAGRLDLESVSMNVPEVIEEVRRILAPQAAAQKIRLFAEIEDDAPRFVMGDPVRLRQVILNLAGNAVKFTHAGSVGIRVHALQRDASSTELRFSVQDTGIGIPKEKQQSIFEPFIQADSTVTRKFGGTGLGLAISNQLVAQMGGHIELESEPGEGSTFSFTARFPIASGTAEVRQTGTPKVRGRGLRILVAEDNPVNQIVAQRLLNREGHFVRIVANGVEAVESVEAEEFDIVLMDNNMPEMDGVEATRIIRSKGYRLPIIALSASAMVGDRERFLGAGMDGHLPKPFRMEELLELLDRYSAPART